MKLVSFEIAKLLKEKGFNWDADHVYLCESFFLKVPEDKTIEYVGGFPAPYLNEVFEWLLEEYDIFLEFKRDIYGFSYSINKKDEDGIFNVSYYNKAYKSYEKCLEAAIFEALNAI